MKGSSEECQGSTENPILLAVNVKTISNKFKLVGDEFLKLYCLNYLSWIALR
jgi:hypothetical protein